MTPPIIGTREHLIMLPVAGTQLHFFSVPPRPLLRTTNKYAHTFIGN